MFLRLYNRFRRRKYKPAGTKEQRLKLYKEMYYEFSKIGKDGPFYYGFCSIVSSLTFYNDFGFEGFLGQLPELYVYRPFNDDGVSFWFPRNQEGLEIRKSILRKILKKHGITVS